MAGYVGYSFSKNAAEAMEWGRMPISHIKPSHLEEWGIDISVAAFKRAVAAGVVTTDEWHHTSKRYNETPFYDLRMVGIDIEDGNMVIIDGELHDA